MGELYALLPIGGQLGTELLGDMERHKPKEDDLWFRWQFISRLPDWIQCQLPVLPPQVFGGVQL